MKNFLPLVLLLSATFAFAEEIKINYDEALVPEYTLPDPLTCNDGTKVTTVEQWEKVRRPEILEQFQREMFGRLPKALREAGNHPDFVTFRVFEQSDDAYHGKAIRKQVEITFKSLTSDETVKANLLIYLPKNAPKPVPMFVGYNFQGNHTITDEPEVVLFHTRNSLEPVDESKLEGKGARGGSSSRWDLDQILDAGYGLATIHYNDVAFDGNRCHETGICKLYGFAHDAESREPDEWGSITAWAWGMGRVMDYFETDPQIDAKRVAVMGHSRLGKTSLWTGASDPRFAIVISNDSGCGGAALSRRNYGETVHRINVSFPFWFCLNFRKYNEDLAALPMDEHELIALMAPRPVYVASASEDKWADPNGEYQSCFFAVPVYQLYGTKTPFDGLEAPNWPGAENPVGNIIGYHCRKGGHDVQSYDWTQYIKFADKYLQIKSCFKTSL
ncbi:MAG: acetylxylan esterase [Thermoguttaceae bacterium]|nr:acetylxylan esterase [Thermoguttaceae bacterium]